MEQSVQGLKQTFLCNIWDWAWLFLCSSPLVVDLWIGRARREGDVQDVHFLLLLPFCVFSTFIIYSICTSECCFGTFVFNIFLILLIIEKKF